MNSSKRCTDCSFRIDQMVYQIGKIIWIPFLAVGFWFQKFGYERYGHNFVCSFRRACGLPCPGCGGTRAFLYLFNGEIAKSFFQNPVVLYMVLAYLHFMCLYFYRKNISHAIVKKEIQINIYLYLTAAIILCQWIVKLIIIFSRII